jgi:pimeloyl-ACP methyl ester carboxylesterase
LTIIDRGTGAPVVVIPGIQGRWEWMRPAIEALAARGRVLTFSLADEPTSGGHFDVARGFWSYVDQVGEALDASGLERAAICGVSYGGLIAAAFAVRYPDRVTSLILVSALPPSWRPDSRVAFYTRRPWLRLPAFCVASLGIYREIAAAVDPPWRARAAAVRIGLNALRHMLHPGRTARRVQLVDDVRIEADLARVQVPVLLVTGEDALDGAVPPRLTREYLGIWPHARSETLARTGHLGLITRPAAFAALVSGFAAEHPGSPS